MSKFQGWKKRILALCLAVLTVVSTWSADLTALAAADNESAGVSIAVNEDLKNIPSGGKIAQVYTSDAEKGKYEMLKKATFDIAIPKAVEIKYSMSVYQNLTDESNPESGECSYSLPEQVMPVKDEDRTKVQISVDIPKKVYLASGEKYAVVFTITSSNENSITYYTCSNILNGKIFEGTGWVEQYGMMHMETETTSEVPTDITEMTLSSDKIVMSTKQKEGTSVTATLSPAYKRDVEFESKDSSVVTVSSDGTTATLTPAGAGETEVTAKVGKVEKTIEVKVLEATLSSGEDASVTYSGETFTPRVTVSGGSEEPAETAYSVTYENNINAGTATAVVTGTGDLAGYTDRVDFTINKKAINSEWIGKATFAIDTSSNRVTNGVMMDNNRTMVFGTDYTASAKRTETTSSGITYEVTVTGIGNYEGGGTVKRTVSATSESEMDINDVVTASLDKSSYVYTSGQIIPSVTFYNKETGEEMSEFANNCDIAYANNVNVGSKTAKVIISGKSELGFKGTITKTFSINKYNVQTNGIEVTYSDGSNGKYVHTGKEINPPIVVKMRGTSTQLTEGMDYTIDYSRNEEIGKDASMTIRGIGNYKGTVTKYFTIIGDLEKDAIVTLDSEETSYADDYQSSYTETYNGSDIKPSEIAVYMGEDELTIKQDYDVAFIGDGTKENPGNLSSAGTKKIVITGKGDYLGKEITVTYTVEPKTITAKLLKTTDYADKVYTGSEITLDPKEYVLTNMVEERDYTISYKNNIEAGSATITATGKGNYEGSTSTNFTILPRLVTDEKVTFDAINPQTYTGSQITPDVVMYYDGNKVDQSNYTVSYNNNVEISKGDNKATVTVTGTKNFTGSYVIPFEITAKSIAGDNITYIVEGNLTTKDGNGNYITNYSTPYTGQECKPVNIIVKDGSTTLKGFSDYSIRYNNNNKVGNRAEIIVTGAGKYEGSSVTLYFEITGRSIDADTIVVDEKYTTEKRNGYTYPVLSIKDTTAALGSQNLVEGRDYELKVTVDSKTSGEGKVVTIVGKGNYSGERTFTYTIGSKLSDEMVDAGMINPFSKAKYSKTNEGYYYVTYIGEHKPLASVVYNKSALKENVDYTLSYRSLIADDESDIYNARTNGQNNIVEVTITGMGDYYGSVAVKYILVSASFGVSVDGQSKLQNNEEFTVNDNGFTFNSEGKTLSCTYSGNKVQLSPIVTYTLPNNEKIALVKDKDYTCVSEIGSDAGTYDVKITGIGNYRSEYSAKYVIDKASIENANRFKWGEVYNGTYTEGKIGTKEYTGVAICPTVRVVDTALNKKQLVNGTDITVSYENNTNVSENAKIIINGTGNYEGKLEIPFSIVKKSIEDQKVVVNPISTQMYTGNEIKPGVTVYYNNIPLKEGRDYQCTYAANIKPGNGTVTIEGFGAFEGARTVQFQILGDISDTSLFDVTGINSSYMLESGNIDVTGVNVKYKNDTAILTKDIDYIVETVNCTVPGVGKIVISGKGKFTGRYECLVTIRGEMSNVTVSGVKTSYEYTGLAIKPIPTVTYGTKTLQAGGDYEISYGENISAGKSSGVITLTGKGDYFSGVKTVNFDIQYNLDNAKVEYVTKSQIYAGDKIEPDVSKVIVNGMEISKSDYSVTYQDNINVGTGKIVISPTSTEKACGSKTVTFTIEPVDLFRFNAQLTLNRSEWEYTGDAIIPKVTVTYNSKSLREGTDYVLEVTNNKNAGTANVRVIGQNNFEGALDKEFKINQKDFASSDVICTVKNAGYAGGNAVIPEYTVTYNGRTLKEGQDYTVTVSGNTTVTDNANVKFVGCGNNFTGSKDVTFSVTQTDLSKGTVEVDSNSSVYTGKAATPQIKVKCPLGNGAYYELQEGTDYYITYNTNLAQMINVGKYQVKITGKGNFINSLNTTYDILPKSLKDVTVTLKDGESYPYKNGNEVEPEVVVKDGERELEQGTDYEINYVNNTASASKKGENAPTVQIVGKGNYTDEVDKTFNIGTEIPDGSIVCAPTVFTYNGKIQKPASVKVTVNNNTLVVNRDYEITDAADLINAGNKTITIKGIGQYYGTASASYFVQQKSVEKSAIKVVLTDLTKNEAGDYEVTYSGQAVEPQIEVYDTEISATTPLRAEDYEVTYVKNDQIGTKESPAYVIVKLKGNYWDGGESISVPFIIHEQDISSYKVTFDADHKPYTGSEIIPGITVEGENALGAWVTLVQNKDYKVTFENNVNAGEATATITGIGNYVGTIEKTFVIYASLKDAQVTVEDQCYTGQAVKPAVKVVCGGNELVAGVDYVADYTSEDNYTQSGKVIITPNNEFYSDNTEATYKIIKDKTLLQVSGYNRNYIYTGKEIKPEFVVTAPDGTRLTYYPNEVRYYNEKGISDAVNVGTVTATITVYMGSDVDTAETVEVEATYQILPCNVNACQIIIVNDNTYTGLPLNPPVIITNDGKDLVENTDYTLQYTNNVNPGRAEAIITGMGNYTGVADRGFKIVSSPVINLKQASSTESTITLSWVKNSHVTGYQIFSGDCRTLYGTSTSGGYIVSGLNPGTEYAFKVRSFVIIDGTTYYGEFKDVVGTTKVGQANAVVSSPSSGSARVTFDSKDNVAGYEIYRATSVNGTYNKIAAIPVKSGAYTDSGLTSGRMYYYKVRTYKKINGTYEYSALSSAKGIKVK